MPMSSEYRVLDYIKPVCRWMPEVSKPDYRVPLREKVMWTIFTLFIFLSCCQIPLYGVHRNDPNDPFHSVRVVVASNRGTLMELGISPIVTSSMLVQLMAGSKFISSSNSKEDKMLLQGAQKFLGFILTLLMAMTYVLSGMYGNLEDLSMVSQVLIIFQLFVAGMIVIVLDEMMQKGYGLGSGISLFIATNICERVVWKTFSFTTINTGRGTEFEGAVMAFFHLLFTRSNKLRALKEALFRPQLPNLSNVAATVLVFLMVVYFQVFRVDLPVQHKKYRGQEGSYPIRLFYTSNIPIIIQTAMVSNLFFFSQLLWKSFPENVFVGLIGRWHDIPGDDKLSIVPVGGLAYYVSPPSSIMQILYDPIHVFFYTLFVVITCGFFSKLWVEVSGSAPKDVARQINEQDMGMKGFRENSIVTVLERYIPTAATFGGMMVGMLTILADLLGAIGSGTGILLAVTIIYSYYEQLAMEQRMMGMGQGLRAVGM